MADFPTVQVLLDDGTGTFPYDVSTYTETPGDLTQSRGRPDEFSDVSPGALALILDDTDSRFSVGDATYNAACDQQIRVKYVHPNTVDTNLLTAANADLESGVGSWAGVNSATLASSTAQAYSGTKSIKITWPTGGIPAASLNQAGLTIGVDYTFSVYLYVPAGNPDVKLQIFGVGSGSTVSVKDQWVRTELAFTATGTSHFLQVVGLSTTAAQIAYMDAAMLNVGDTAGEFNTVTSTTYTRWTGRVQSWPVSWPGGSDGYATATITAIDVLAALTRLELRAASIEEALVDSEFVYPFNEAVGAAYANDVSTNSGPALPVADDGNTAYTFGVATTFPDSSTGLQAVANSSGGTAEMVATGGTWTASSISLTIAFLAPPGSGGTLGGVTGTGLTNSSVSITALTGYLHWFSLNPATAVDDSAWHVVTAQADSTGQEVWLDGVLLDSSATAVAGTFGNATTYALSPETLSTLTVAHFAIGPRISSARVQTRHDAILNDLTGETAAARVARVAGYAGVATGTVDTTGGTTMGKSSHAGRSAMDVLNDVATATFGVVYADGNGDITFTDGQTIVGALTPDASLDAAVVTPQTEFVVDMAGVVNYSVGSSPDSATTTVVSDATSIVTNNHGVYRTDYEWNVDTSDQAAGRTHWVVGSHAEPAPRVGSLVINMLQCSVTDQAAVLALEPGSWLQVTGLPAQTPGGTTADFVVEGWSETCSDTSWTVTVNAANRTVAAPTPWILGDSTYGVLGSTTKLFI